MTQIIYLVSLVLLTSSCNLSPRIVSASQYLDSVYKDKSAFTDYSRIDAKEQQIIQQQKHNIGYGELTEVGMQNLFSELQMQKGENFYDLGSGSGKINLYAYLTQPIGRSVGIELVQYRIDMANQALSELENLLKTNLGLSYYAFSWSKKVEFIHQDLLESDLSNANTIYWSNLLFPEHVVTDIVEKVFKALPKGAKIISTKGLTNKDLNTPQGHLKFIKELYLETTWAKKSHHYLYIKI